MWREIKKIIQSHQNFIITTHVNPDGDGIGAACALTELLIQMGKSVRFVSDSPIPRKYAILDFHQTHEEYSPETDFSQAQVLVVLDTHRKERIGRLETLLDKPGIEVLCIDHHEVADPFTEHLAIDPKACSVGAMVYTLYKESGYDLNLRAATGIYVSIICDTGRFSYSSTSRKAHKIADECIKLGVDPDFIHHQLFQHISLGAIKIFAKALEGMEVYLDKKVAVQQIRKADCDVIGGEVSDLEHIDLEYIHDFNNLIEDIHCFVLLRELGPNRVRVSLRSKTYLDISHIVRSLGGGGHANAAGLCWNGSMEDVKIRIISLLEDLFDKHKENVQFAS